MHQHDDNTVELTERDESFFRISLAGVLAGDRKAIPDCINAFEVQAVDLEVPTSLRFVPGWHRQIVVTIYSAENGVASPSCSLASSSREPAPCEIKRRRDTSTEAARPPGETAGTAVAPR